LVAGDHLKKPKPEFPDKHKKTIIDFEREEDYQKIKKTKEENARRELLKLYEEDPETQSSVLLNLICEKCNQNSRCSNYQDYQNFLNKNEPITNN